MSVKMCHSEPSSAAQIRSPARNGIESRYPLKIIKKWSWVVFVMVLATLPPLTEANQDFDNLKASVVSHGQSLHNMERYLRKTDRFWNWYQENYKRLNELLAEGPTTRPLDTTASQSSLTLLEKKLDSMQKIFEEKLEAQENEMKSLRNALEIEKDYRGRMEDDQTRVTEELQERLLQQAQTLQECQSSVRKLEEDQLYPLAEQLKTLNASVESQQVDIQQLQQDSSKHTSQIAGIRTRMQTKFRGVAMKTHVDQRLTNFERKINSINRKVNTPKTQGSSQQIDRQLTKLHTDVANLQGSISRLEGADRRLTASNSNQENKINGIRTSLDVLENHSGDMNLKNVASIEKLKERVIKLETRTEEMHSSRVQGAEALTRSSSGQANFLNGYPGTSGSPGAADFSGRSGEPGSRGAPGRPGAPGPSGESGSRGAPGSPGAPGPSGESGPRGASGSPGAPGPSGESGSRGAPGSPGAPGPLGESGFRGAPGRPGDSGARGTPGRPGPAGPPGGAGPRGAPGSRGQQGSPGNSGNPGEPGLPGEYGVSGSYGISGPPGRQGHPGPAG